MAHFPASNQGISTKFVDILVPYCVDNEGSCPAGGKNWGEVFGIIFRLSFPHFLAQFEGNCWRLYVFRLFNFSQARNRVTQMLEPFRNKGFCSSSVVGVGGSSKGMRSSVPNVSIAGEEPVTVCSMQR